MQDVQRRAAEQLQAGQRRTAFIEVIDIKQNARLGMAALDGDVHDFAQSAQALGKAPQLDLGHDAHLVAEFQQAAITLGGFGQAQVGLVGRPGRRSGKTLAADLLQQVHAAFCLFQTFLALRLVIHDPLGEADRAFDS